MRSATLSARARQLTPQAEPKENCQWHDPTRKHGGQTWRISETASKLAGRLGSKAREAQITAPGAPSASPAIPLDTLVPSHFSPTRMNHPQRSRGPGADRRPESQTGSAHVPTGSPPGRCCSDSRSCSPRSSQPTARLGIWSRDRRPLPPRPRGCGGSGGRGQSAVRRMREVRGLQRVGFGRPAAFEAEHFTEQVEVAVVVQHGQVLLSGRRGDQRVLKRYSMAGLG